MLTIDGHCDLLSFLLEQGVEMFYTDSSEVQITNNSFRAGGPELLVTAIYLSQKYLPHQRESKALKMAGIFWQLAKEGVFTPVLNKSDLKRPGKKALLAIEGGEPISSVLDIYAFYQLGVRMISLTWNYQNHLATGCTETYTGGLTTLAKELIKTLDDLGIIIDVSHLSEGSFWELLELIDGPIIASHSNAYTLKRHSRNLKDEALKEIAKKDGVVGVNFCPMFLGNSTKEAVIRQIVYIAELIGVNYVGIGSDYLGISTTPMGLEDISKWITLKDDLNKEGFNAKEIELIMGGNFQRVFENKLL